MSGRNEYSNLISIAVLERGYNGKLFQKIEENYHSLKQNRRQAAEISSLTHDFVSLYNNTRKRLEPFREQYSNKNGKQTGGAVCVGSDSVTYLATWHKNPPGKTLA